jgi:hypothetical protein
LAAETLTVRTEAEEAALNYLVEIETKLGERAPCPALEVREGSRGRL